ncbi:MAG: PIN domain-containing protein [Rhodoplanes sp.]|jgi:predicted nucleic acid-binding protein
MNALVFLDTRIALYLLDQRDLVKTQRVQEWVGRLIDLRSLIVSPQVLNEVYWIGRKKFPNVPIEELKRFVRDFMPNCRAPLNATITRAAFKIEEQYGLSWWDCLIVASALAARCHLLLTEDMQHGMRIDTLTVLSPFRTTPSQALSQS